MRTLNFCLLLLSQQETVYALPYSDYFLCDNRDSQSECINVSSQEIVNTYSWTSPPNNTKKYDLFEEKHSSFIDATLSNNLRNSELLPIPITKSLSTKIPAL